MQMSYRGLLLAAVIGVGSMVFVVTRRNAANFILAGARRAVFSDKNFCETGMCVVAGAGAQWIKYDNLVTGITSDCRRAELLVSREKREIPMFTKSMKS